MKNGFNDNHVLSSESIKCAIEIAITITFKSRDLNDRYVKTSNLSHINDLYEKTLNSLYLIIYKNI